MVEGRKDAPYLFILPFMDDEGVVAWFWQKLHESGILKTDVRVVYLLEEPPKNTGKRPSVTQLRDALPRFSKEIEESSPVVILPMGGFATYYITGIKEHIADTRGYLIPRDQTLPVVQQKWTQIGEYKTGSKKTGRIKGDPRYKWVSVGGEAILPPAFSGFIIPTFDLNHLRLTGFAVQPAFKVDVLRARRVVNGGIDLLDDKFSYYISPSVGRDRLGLEYGTQRLEDRQFGATLAIDIETHGIDNEVIDRVSFSDGEITATLLWDQYALDLLNQLVSDKSRVLVFHNEAFDRPRLIAAGVKITDEHETVDTMFLSVVLQPDLSKALGRVATLHFDLYGWKWEHLKSGYDDEQYSAKDAFVTIKLEKTGQTLMEGLGMWPLFSGKNFPWGPGLMKTLPVLSDMTAGGLRINKVYASEWTTQLSDELLVHLGKWSEIFPHVDPGSNPDMCKLFYGHWGLPIHRTKKEGITVNELAVMKTREYIKTEYAQKKDEAPWKDDPRCRDEIFQLLLDIRGVVKNLGTYALPANENETAWVHPQYLPESKDEETGRDGTGAKGNTATGRLAASRPNIQNQPEIARWLYLPDFDHWCFVQRDYSRAELYAMAYSAQDEVMIADLASGDPYRRLANAVGTDRDTGKNVLLAGQYLAGAPKVSDMILSQQHIYVSPKICKEVLDGIKERYTRVTAYKRWLALQCKTKGWIRNPFGRVRFFYDRRAAAAVDFIPQSIVADILWCVLLDLHIFVKSLGGRLTTTVHDSVLAQVPQDKVAECAAGMKQIMERPFDCVAPGFFLPTECEVGAPGASWGELEKYDDSARVA